MTQLITISPSLVETWLLLATSEDPKLEKSRNNAADKLRNMFGDIDQAIRYLKETKQSDG